MATETTNSMATLAAGLAGGIVGVVLKSILDLVSDKFRFGRDNTVRDRLDRRAGYVELLAALADDGDGRILMESFQDEMKERDLAGKTSKADSLDDTYDELHRAWRESHQRINKAMAIVQVTAPAHVFDLALIICGLLNRPADDPEATGAMDALVEAIKVDLMP